MEFESEVGTIVWVRRRNGSWWPGKILGGEELSASHLMSPRSGTPVKLLGREDASVDWYNLEKSKRVKPFRCGEFDDCITRAQASQGMPPKKREKYARREDAILHALDLEKQFLHKKYPNLQTPLPLNSKPVNNNNPPPPPASYHHNGDDDVDDVDLSPQDTIKRKRPRHDDDDDNDKEEESINKRRLNTSPKLPPNPMPLQTHPLLLLVEEDNKTQVADPPVMAAAAAAAAASGDSSDHTPDHLLQGEKRKPSPEDQSMQLQLDHKEHPKSDESFDYNQTPLSDWVDVSTPKSQNAFTFGLSEENNTTEEDDDDDEEDEEEDTETDSSGTESLSSDTYDATLSDDADQIEFIPKVFGRSETGEDESMSDADESDESLPTSVTVSKWQLKGKRNTRSLMKRYRNAASDNKLLVGSSQWMSYRGGEDRLAADSFDKRLRSQAIGFNMPTRDVGLDSSHDIINSVEGYWEQQPTDYHDSSLAYMSSLQFGGRMKSMLIDVDVQVQSGYQREHVPMISLMSKLNDKAIVGHPIPVETIQDGSSDIILSAAETYEYQTESLVLDPDDTALQPWRTARRTAKCRVPRPPAQDEYAAADEERKHNNRKGGSISRKWPSQKLQKKPQRRSVLSHSQKIRTLSSIGGGDQISDLRAEEGVMKPAAAAVACIPVKLVFSRLHEELVARHQ